MRVSLFLIVLMSSFVHAYIPTHPIGFVPQQSNRPDNAPFITGDTFRNFCDHIFDETNQVIATQMINPGDTIFVNADILYRFFKYIHPHITVPYILVTHNSDMSVPDYFAPYLDDPKLIA